MASTYMKYDVQFWSAVISTADLTDGQTGALMRMINAQCQGVPLSANPSTLARRLGGDRRNFTALFAILRSRFGDALLVESEATVTLPEVDRALTKRSRAKSYEDLMRSHGYPVEPEKRG